MNCIRNLDYSGDTPGYMYFLPGQYSRLFKTLTINQLLPRENYKIR